MRQAEASMANSQASTAHGRLRGASSGTASGSSSSIRSATVAITAASRHPRSQPPAANRKPKENLDYPTMPSSTAPWTTAAAAWKQSQGGDAVPATTDAEQKALEEKRTAKEAQKLKAKEIPGGEIPTEALATSLVGEEAVSSGFRAAKKPEAGAASLAATEAASSGCGQHTRASVTQRKQVQDYHIMASSQARSTSGLQGPPCRGPTRFVSLFLSSNKKFFPRGFFSSFLNGRSEEQQMINQTRRSVPCIRTNNNHDEPNEKKTLFATNTSTLYTNFHSGVRERK